MKGSKVNERDPAVKLIFLFIMLMNFAWPSLLDGNVGRVF